MCLSLRESVSVNTVSFCVPFIDTASHTVHASGQANASAPDTFARSSWPSDPAVFRAIQASYSHRCCYLIHHMCVLVASNTYACVYMCEYTRAQASRSAILQLTHQRQPPQMSGSCRDALTQKSIWHTLLRLRLPQHDHWNPEATLASA